LNQILQKGIEIMRFRIVAILSLLLSIPTGLFLSRVIAKASTITTVTHQEPVVYRGNGDAVVELPKGHQFKAAWHAGWEVDFPAETRSGQFSVTGTLQINPDINQKEESIAISVLVDDALTHNNLDMRNHGMLTVNPFRSYNQVVSEKFDLPTGLYRIRFLAVHADAGVTHSVFAERTHVVTVD
jgi:hypothetical protein